MSESWKTPSVIVASCAAIISLISFGVSVRSCSISQRSFDLTAEDFRSERFVIWQANLSEDNKRLFIKATDDETTIHSGTVYFPPQINDTEWVLRQPDFSLPLTVLRFDLQEFISSKYPKKDGYSQVSLDNKIPMVIDSKYILKGELYSDISLYSLNYSVVINDEKYSLPKINFLGITYLKRFKQTSRDSLIQSLKEIYDSVQIWVPAISPEDFVDK